MSKEYDKEKTGTLGKNNDKDQENPQWPDYKGKCQIHGEEFWISAWIKENKETGEKFFSLAFKSKEQQDTEQNDIPF